MATFDVVLECGTKRTFASAVEWPGWCRPGRSEAEALEALFLCGVKYEAILADTSLGFAAPRQPAALAVVERLPGDATTDFGAPGAIPSADQERFCSEAEMERFTVILEAGWRAFDKAVDSARGKTLTTGPRGGGRTLDAIVKHVLEADAAYLRAVGWKAPPLPSDAGQVMGAVREAVRAALEASAEGSIPARGPRGGTRWPARYFVRRVVWHVIAHAWEIERRLAAGSGPLAL